MKYYLSKTIAGDFQNVILLVTEFLKDEGFGVLTEINVRETMKKKLDIDYKDYVILGACNPYLAIRAFQAEDKIGTLLPCNVAVIDQGDGKIEVAIMNAQTMMNHIGNPALEVLAMEANERLTRVLNRLK